MRSKISGAQKEQLHIPDKNYSKSIQEMLPETLSNGNQKSIKKKKTIPVKCDTVVKMTRGECCSKS